MIAYDTLLSIPFLEKSSFTGSEKGMRYQVKKEKNPAYDPEAEDQEEQKKEKEFLLEAVVWPGPFAREFTREDLFIAERFSFDNAGRKDAVDWLNEQYTARADFFTDVALHPQRYVKQHHKS